MTQSVRERLESLGDLFEERHSVYGDDYEHVGEILMGLFPGGIDLRTARDFQRFYMFIFMLSKLNRYSRCLVRREGHPDSLNDLSVYSQMVNKLDEET